MRRRLVIDASIAAKWILPEPGTAAASALLHEEDVELHAPELFTAELGNMLWERARRGELALPEAAADMQRVLDMPVERHPHEPIAAVALATALAHDITVYDALYVALGRSLDATVITADRKLAAAGAADPDWPVQLLGG